MIEIAVISEAVKMVGFIMGLMDVPLIMIFLLFMVLNFDFIFWEIYSAQKW